MAVNDSSAAVLVEIDAGVCGHVTRVHATKTDGYKVRLSVESTCPHVRNMAVDLDEVDAVQQIGLRQGLPSVLETAYGHCAHAACPVPAGLVKGVEVAAGLALPRDVMLRISREQVSEGADS